MSEPVLIRRVRDPYGWLGNMSPYCVVLYGHTWRTTEALFQAMRFKEGSAIREVIRAQKSPMAAKMMAKKDADQMVVTPLSGEDLDNMRTCLRLKLEAHPELVDWLRVTGNRPIIEDCTNRQRGSGLFWGAALKDGEWVGENWLGKLWMDLRETLHD